MAAWIDRLIKQREKANRLLSMATVGAVELKGKADKEDPVLAGVIINRLLPDDVGNTFWGRRKELEEQHLAEIEHEFRGLILARLPLLPDDVYGRQALDEVVTLLAKQL